MDERLKKYHTEEIIMILLILSTDMSSYDEEDLVCFTEQIEGRIEVLFEPDFIITLDQFSQISKATLIKLHKLELLITSLYSSQWHKKLSLNNQQWKFLAIDILRDLGVKYLAPLVYQETHLNLDE